MADRKRPNPEDAATIRRAFVEDGLRREDFTEARIAEIAAEAATHGLFRILSAEEREVSRRGMLRDVAAEEDVWIFGYGSLMWNPAIHVKERRPALLRGYHRSFCLSTPIGRGTPEQPGLVLALEPGGSVRGMALRIDTRLVESETRIVWRREMLSGAYRPRWVRLSTDAGPLKAITFVVNQRHDRYAGRLPEAELVQRLATAEGRIGRCRDYLHNTVVHLDELGIRDGAMHRLLDLVNAYRDEI